MSPEPQPLPAEHPARIRGLRTAMARVAMAVAAVVSVSGCDYDSWMDPSRTGYFEHTPTSIPILRKIDVIEVEEDAFATEIGPPRPEDLVGGAPDYVFAAGDVLEVQINDLFQVDKAEQFRRSVDQSGKIVIPIIGAIEVSGKTQTQLIDYITEKLRPIIRDPRVSVTVLEGRAFTFVVSGEVRNTGVYALTRPDFDVVQAVGLAGGAQQGVKRIRIVRLEEDDLPMDANPPGQGKVGAAAAPTSAPEGGAPQVPATPAADAPSVDDLLKQIAPPAEGAPAPSPGALRTPTVAPIDVDQLAAPTVAEPGGVAQGTEVRAPATTVPGESKYVFDTQKQEWVLSGPSAPDSMARLTPPNSPDGAYTGPAAAAAEARRLVRPEDYRLPTGRKVRVILVDWVALLKGDLSQAVVIRPGDKIFAELDLGVVYIDGEIARPGVYNLPPVGELTLSRLVAAAGGLGQIAIPQRVDLVRKVAADREAVLRVNLAAIRNKAEPDILMRADDHVIIGTNFFATPLAVIRNGFRMTYGFGFLLDRNFGNDVFGAPPVNVIGG
jgi:polysaccharide export outer membrane protein